MDREYSGKNIKVLEGLEAVRTRPGMYIGDTGEEGLHHMIWEILDNSVDEVLAGYGNKITIEINKDDSITVTDEGRGIPVDIHPTEGISSATVVLTVLHAGGKFDSQTYKTSGGLHGVGASVVNALSSYLNLIICREGKKYQQEFERGKPLYDLKEIGKCKQTGTSITFKPDETIFKETTTFKEELIIDRIKALTYLNKGLKIILINHKTNETKEFYSENGLIDFIREEVPQNNQLIEPIFIKGEEGDIQLECVFVYEKGFNKKILSFVNNVVTPEGGTHETGVMNAFIRSFTDALKNNSKTKGLTAEDIKEGLHSIISIRIPNPEFRGQTKGKLNNPEARTVSYQIVKKYMENWIEENPKNFEKLVKKFITAKKAREAAKRSREIVQKADNSIGTMPGKLADCRTKDRSKAELFLVEGDSAGGSAKQGRDRETQAILPLKGKILNVLKATYQKALANEEIKALITALGVGIGKNYDYNKLRYNKIIIMSDADVDGGHIAFLNLLFFHTYFPELIEKGHIYVAVPPLYRAKKGKTSFYIKDDKEKQEKFPTKASEKGWTISRFKGLGEMNPEQLWETTMNPKTRTLIQVKYDKNGNIDADQLFNLLGGDLGAKGFRKWFLMTFANYVEADI